MKKIAFSGTLDPITNGHMWVIGEARAMADDVTVFLSENPSKKPLFPAEKRKQIIEQSAAERGWTNVSVVIVRGDYTARAAKKHGIDYLIRGVRNNADFDYENLIQQTNVDVLQGAKTIFVMPPRDLGSVSSSFVRALQGPVGWHWSMKKFVPRAAYAAWILDWLYKEWQALWQYDASALDAAANADWWFHHLTSTAAYGNGTRHYHNLDHLVHGLTEIRVWGLNVDAKRQDIDSVKKAFWFHDAVYSHVEHALTNEEASARLWIDSGLGSQETDDVATLIHATSHFASSSEQHRLKGAMLGADLAILGQDEEVYDAYGEAVRKEYGHVPDAAYNAHRCRALLHLQQEAQKNSLFTEAYFADQYNEKALVNIARELMRRGGAEIA